MIDNIFQSLTDYLSKIEAQVAALEAQNASLTAALEAAEARIAALEETRNIDDILARIEDLEHQEPIEKPISEEQVKALIAEAVVGMAVAAPHASEMIDEETGLPQVEVELITEDDTTEEDPVAPAAESTESAAMESVAASVEPTPSSEEHASSAEPAKEPATERFEPLFDADPIVVSQPVEPKSESVATSTPAVETVVEENTETAEVSATEENKTTIAEAFKTSTPAQENAPVAASSVGLAPKLTDLKKGISLGDRFLFQRELFSGNGELMTKTISLLNEMSSMEEAEKYIHSHFQWNQESHAVELFYNLLKRKF